MVTLIITIFAACEAVSFFIQYYQSLYERRKKHEKYNNKTI